jgi:hypothetical protein
MRRAIELVGAPVTIAAASVAIALSGCSVQRAIVANDAQQKMVGLTREEVLACMGPPAAKMGEGSTEVWSYGSGNGRTTTVASATTETQANVMGGTGTATSSGFGTATTTRRSCTVNVNMVDGRVSRVNYVGATGGLLTPGEQCAFAIQNCVH